MKNIIKLNAENLPLIAKEVKKPSYNRNNIKASIVHVGIGGFHRAHQAYYADLLMENFGVTDCGICGIALLNGDKRIYDTLVNQNGLYTLMINEADGKPSARVIGSIVEYLFAPENPSAVIEKMAHPDTKIISLTITEGGYNFNASTGDFQEEEPTVLADIANPLTPKTIFGYLNQAFKLRKERGLPGLTIQSCDNIQHNGSVAKKMITAYIKLANPDLLVWVNENVSFPNSMVDRITPVTATTDIDSLKETFGVDDAWPVVCEPFCQWVIEDDFKTGRPDWDKVGAQFVDLVDPYEKMKIRFVNGGHVALGFTGYLNGYSFVYETMEDQDFKNFVQNYLDEDATPILDEVPGINLKDYKETLIQRFANPHIKDQLTRIFSESSAKIPKFLIPTINEQIKINGSFKRCALMIAAWCNYLENIGADEIEKVQDDMKLLLVDTAKQSINNDELAFLKIESIFGDLASKAEFTNVYLPIMRDLRSNGIKSMIKNLA
jgi:mannitol 2-dehydrogenase